MPEYIEREDAIKAISIVHGELIEIGEVVDILDEMPAADVQSVKHGRWISDCCSNCGISKYNFISFNIVGENEYARPFGTWLYCPRCGAKMVGEA